MYPCGDTRFARSSVSESANAVTKTTGTASSARSRSAAAIPSAPSRRAMSIRTRSGRTSAASARALADESAVPTTSCPSRRRRSSTSSATTASSSTTRMRADFAGSMGSAPGDRDGWLPVDGERQGELGPAIALQRRGPPQLADERRDQALAERPGTPEALGRCGQPDAVVGDDERRVAVLTVERDGDRAALALGKGVLQRVREQLVEDQPAGDRDVQVEGDRLDVDDELDRTTHLSGGREHVPGEPIDVVAEIDPGEVT